MPIKFRCQHCRQFLGISRTQAGGIVDCPTCGRTIRVPELDGTVAPLPRPGLDPKDSKLAAALSELASIGDEDGLPAPAQDSFDKSPANAERETSMPDSDPGGKRPSPLLRNFVVLGPEGEPIDFDALPDPSSIAPVNPEAPPTGGNIGTLDEIPPPAPVEVPVVNPEPAEDAALPNDDSMKQERPWAETAQPGDSWKKLLAAANNQSGEELPESDPAPVPATSTESKTVLAPGTPASTGGLSMGLLFALLGLGAALFAGGFFAGRVTTVGGDNTNPQPKSGTDNEAGGGDSTPSTDTADPGSTASRVAFRGRITFQSDGQRKPDRGARVIVLPRERTSTVKLPVAGFRSGDPESDQRIAIAALTAMGGAFALASDEGEFEVSLPSSGQFYVLVLSNSVMRDGDGPDPDAEATTGEYFDRPTQLLGRVECYLEEVRWDGDGAEPLDHSFRG